MKDGLSLRCVLPWPWISRVWTVIAIVHRKCCQGDVWACSVASLLCCFQVHVERAAFPSQCWVAVEESERRTLNIVRRRWSSNVRSVWDGKLIVVVCRFFPSLSVFSAQPWRSRLCHRSVRCLCTRVIMDLEGWIWSFFVNPFSFTVLCDDLGCFWLWCTGCVWSPLNRFCSWALVLLIFSAEWFSSDDHHDQCFDEWTNLFLISGYNVTQRCTDVKQVSFLCVVRCFFVKDFACFPICFSKVDFFGWLQWLFCQFLKHNISWVWCSCLASINWTQIDTIGLIAASLSMVEAVSCTDVSPHADKLWGSEKTALCSCQGLNVWWSCTSPRRVKMLGYQNFCMSWWRGFSCHFNPGCCGGALLFIMWVRFLPKASSEPRFHHY